MSQYQNVACSPPLPYIPDHAFLISNHEPTDHITKQWNTGSCHGSNSAIQLLPYCAITFATQVTWYKLQKNSPFP